VATNDVRGVLLPAFVTDTEKNCGRRGPLVSDNSTEIAADVSDRRITVERKIIL
jgi:hypothetical protein